MMYDDYGMGMTLAPDVQRTGLRVVRSPASGGMSTLLKMAQRARETTLARAAAERSAAGGYQQVAPAMPILLAPQIQPVQPIQPLRQAGPVVVRPPAAPTMATAGAPAAAGFQFQPWMLAALAIPLLLMKRR